MKSIVAFLASIILNGCSFVGSSEPFVPERAAIGDDRLLGTWESTWESGEDDSSSVTRVTVVANGHRSYMIKFDPSDETDTQALAARLGRFGNRWILDLGPGGDAAQIVDQWQSFVMPIHIAVVLEFKGAEVTMSWPDTEAIYKDLRSGKISLKYHELPHNDLLLIGETSEIVAALSEWMGRPDIVTTVVWHRPEEPEEP